MSETKTAVGEITEIQKGDKPGEWYGIIKITNKDFENYLRYVERAGRDRVIVDVNNMEIKLRDWDTGKEIEIK